MRFDIIFDYLFVLYEPFSGIFGPKTNIGSSVLLFLCENTRRNDGHCAIKRRIFLEC
jgi:hypothetical protein